MANFLSLLYVEMMIFWIYWVNYNIQSNLTFLNIFLTFFFNVVTRKILITFYLAHVIFLVDCTGLDNFPSVFSFRML